MVTRKTLRLFENGFKFSTAVELNKCPKQIKLPISLNKCAAPIAELLCVQEVVTPIYTMSYYIKWVTTSWAYGTVIFIAKTK